MDDVMGALCEIKLALLGVMTSYGGAIRSSSGPACRSSYRNARNGLISAKRGHLTIRFET